MAALHNDGLLVLDELSQIDGKEAGQVAYMLANGTGKARASRTGAARQPARWRLLLLSAGEVSLAGLMAADGRKANAGQEVRLADIPADAGAGMGAFERLHGHPTPAALAQAIKDAASQYHGAAGVEFLRRIVADQNSLPARIAEGVRQFTAAAVPASAAGQVIRVGQRFALVAVAGELATGYGLTGWPSGSATAATRTCFDAWLSAFGGTGNREERALFAQVRAFFEAHGSSRFENWDASHEQRILNRAGFYKSEGMDMARTYYVLPEAFKNELVKGYDHRWAAKTLLAAGWLKSDGDGRTTQKPRLPDMGPVRCYVFSTGKVWEGGDDEASSFATDQKSAGTTGTTSIGAGFSVPASENHAGTSGDNGDEIAQLSPLSPLVPEARGRGKPSIGAAVPVVPAVPAKKSDSGNATGQIDPPATAPPATTAPDKPSKAPAKQAASAAADQATGDLFNISEGDF